jgi:hypothetical protein
VLVCLCACVLVCLCACVLVCMCACVLVYAFKTLTIHGPFTYHDQYICLAVYFYNPQLEYCAVKHFMAVIVVIS